MVSSRCTRRRLIMWGMDGPSPAFDFLSGSSSIARYFATFALSVPRWYSVAWDADMGEEWRGGSVGTLVSSTFGLERP